MAGPQGSSTKEVAVTVMETEDTLDEGLQKEGVDAQLRREQSPLLSLPPELLENILYHMDAATCFVSLISCKRIFEAAQTKRVLLRHLNRMPGLRLGLDHNLATLNLLESFRRRATKSLCAAGILANISRYAPNDDLTNITRSAISPGRPVLMATAHQYGEIRVYELSERYVRLKAELTTDLEYDRKSGEEYHMEVLRMDFSRDKDLSVLCRPDLTGSKAALFVDEAESFSKEDQSTLRLVGRIFISIPLCPRYERAGHFGLVSVSSVLLSYSF